jgi:hypothetical protein
MNREERRRAERDQRRRKQSAGWQHLGGAQQGAEQSFVGTVLVDPRRSAAACSPLTRGPG